MSTTTDPILFRQQPVDNAKFGLITGYFFTINVVVGSGFLALPFNFNLSGWALSLIFMLLVGLITYYLTRQVLEILCRIECIKQFEDNGIILPKPTFREMILGGNPRTKLPDEIKLEITKRRFEMTNVAGFLFGPKYGLGYMICIYLVMSGAEVGYSSIFASSLAATIPLGFADTCNIYEDSSFFGTCRPNYWFFLCIYSACMMYLTIKGLKEQRWLQSVLTIMRFVIISIILITCLALIGSHSSIDSGSYTPYKMPEAVNISTMLSSLPSIFFAFTYQLSIPTIAEFIKNKKRNLPLISLFVSASIGTVYALIGFIVPIAIHKVAPQCTINYSNYTGGYDRDNRPGWTYFIAYLVVLFPAMDVFSCFPLMATAVSNNLLTMKYGTEVTDRNTRRKYRAIAVGIPLLISFIMFNLGEIIDWVGLTTFILVPIAVPMMHSCVREMINIPSPFDAPFYSRVTDI